MIVGCPFPQNKTSRKPAITVIMAPAGKSDCIEPRVSHGDGSTVSACQIGKMQNFRKVRSRGCEDFSTVVGGDPSNPGLHTDGIYDLMIFIK